MKIKSEDLINDLIKRTQQTLKQTQQLKKLPLEILNKKSAPESWSALECIEHLSLYGDFYLPEIEKKIQQSNSKPSPFFRSGILGNYFAKSMLPKEQLNKMKTFKDKNPLGSKLDLSTLDRFIAQQQKTIQLLHQAKSVSLTKTKTAISISKWIKLRLGDTFRVVIYHNQRHLAQATKAINNG